MVPGGSPSVLARMDVITDGFAELTLETGDPALLERFYVDAFGLRVLEREHDRVWLAAGAHARLGLWSPGPKEFGAIAAGAT